MEKISDLMELLKGEDARDIYFVAEVFAEIQIIEILKAKGVNMNLVRVNSNHTLP